MKKFALVLAPLFLASALLAACGGGTQGESVVSEEPSASQESTTPSAEPVSSEEPVHEHSYTTVDLVAPTTEAAGASDYLKCEECGKIFDSKHEELTAVPELAKIETAYTVSQVGSLGSVVEGKISIYNDGDVVSKADIDNDYVIGVDADGVVIYAGRFGGAGYGGPGDGFYHDGNYAVTAGQICGIFDLDERWAGWPAQVDLDGDGIEETGAWTLFDVVVPTGGYIIAGEQTLMADIMSDLAGVEKDVFLAEENNHIFEAELGDGALNKTRAIEVVEGDAQAAVYVHTIVPPVVSGVFYEGTKTGSMTETEEGSGIYTLDIELALWNNVSLYKVEADGTKTTIWYDNTAISGFVTASDADGADWTVRLYHEGTDKKLLTCTEGTYRLIYDSNADTLEVIAKGLIVEGANGGNAYKEYVLVEAEGDTVYTKEMAEWGKISFHLYGADLTETTLWYDTVTVSGNVRAQDVTGTDWGKDLYHETAEGLYWFSYTGGTYTFTYNATNSTLAIAVAE